MMTRQAKSVQHLQIPKVQFFIAISPVLYLRLITARIAGDPDKYDQAFKK
jgi:hypothetical protein